MDDEPQTCYYTGRGPCGDCFNPQTKLPMNCFAPLIAEDPEIPKTNDMEMT
jgi:hypothetical protein